MKTAFLKLGILLAMSIVAVGFVSCNRDEPMPNDNFVIVARNITALNGNIDEVAFVWFRKDLKAPFLNNRFVLELPSLSDGLLFPPIEFLQIPLTITGNPNVKWSSSYIDVLAFNRSRNIVGSFRNEILDERSQVFFAITNWVYADSDAVVIGDHTMCGWGCHRLIVDISVRKGWNIYYVIGKELDGVFTTKMTSQRPPGRFQWTFTSWDSN